MRPELDNHWALRDFASRLMAQICKNFNTSTNNIQTRVTRMFSNAIQQGDKLALSSLYGALEGLSELGPEVIKTFILHRTRSIGNYFYLNSLSVYLYIYYYSNLGARIEQHLEGSLISNLDKIAAGHIKSLLVKVLAPVIKNLRNPPDHLEEYKAEYGYLGPALQNAVMKARMQPATTTTNSTNVTNNTITCAGANIARTVTATSGIVQQQVSIRVNYREILAKILRNLSCYELSIL